jgi:hypothetical protein
MLYRLRRLFDHMEGIMLVLAASLCVVASVPHA